MNDIFARVAARANAGGLPITAEGVQEIDQLLFEERIAWIKRGVKPLAAAERGEGGGASTDRQGDSQLTGSCLSPKNETAS